MPVFALKMLCQKNIYSLTNKKYNFVSFGTLNEAQIMKINKRIATDNYENLEFTYN